MGEKSKKQGGGMGILAGRAGKFWNKIVRGALDPTRPPRYYHGRSIFAYHFCIFTPLKLRKIVTFGKRHLFLLGALGSFERSGDNSSCWGLNGQCGIPALVVVRVGA